MSWQKAFKTAFRSTKDLENFLNTKVAHTPYSLFIPQKFAQRIKQAGPNSVLWKQFIPSSLENNDSGLADPIGDQIHAKGNGLIHRYHNRALITLTENCPIHCRYCFRKNELHQGLDDFKLKLDKARDYLQDHTDINEIIFTGGDPLMVSNQKLSLFLDTLAQIESIDTIRFHTRTPIILPERIDNEFIETLKKFESRFQILTVIHTNHHEEFDDEVDQALSKLQTLDQQILVQSVLLKGVNDSAETLKIFFKDLVRKKIRPYYLHHPDQVKGGMHFYLSLEDGRKIYAQLRNELSGWALPQYVVDLPGGEGKVSAFNPETYQYSGVMLNRTGQSVPGPNEKHIDT